MGLGELREIGVVQLGGLLIAENEAIFGELDGGRDDRLEAELAVFLLCVGEAGDRAGHGNGFVAQRAGVGDHVALCVEVHVARGGAGRFFAVVDEEVVLARPSRDARA